MIVNTITIKFEKGTLFPENFHKALTAVISCFSKNYKIDIDCKTTEELDCYCDYCNLGD